MSHPRPLLLVGGFLPFFGKKPYGLIVRYLRRAGFEPEVVDLCGSNITDLYRCSEVVTSNIVDLQCASHDNGKIDILTYSAGGVAAMIALQSHPWLATDVVNFVSYGTPWQGTPMSLLAAFPLGNVPVAQQLWPFGLFIQQLRLRGLPTGPNYISVAGSADRICPVNYCRMPGSPLLITKYDHSAFWYNRHLWDTLLRLFIA